MEHIRNYQRSVGKFHSLTYAQTQRRQVNARSLDLCIRQPTAKVKEAVEHDGKRLTIIALQGTTYLVKMPDGTYGRVDIRTERFLGAA